MIVWPCESQFYVLTGPRQIFSVRRVCWTSTRQKLTKLTNYQDRTYLTTVLLISSRSPSSWSCASCGMSCTRTTISSRTASGDWLTFTATSPATSTTNWARKCWRGNVITATTSSLSRASSPRGSPSSEVTSWWRDTGPCWGWLSGTGSGWRSQSQVTSHLSPYHWYFSAQLSSISTPSPSVLRLWGKSLRSSAPSELTLWREPMDWR